MVEQEIHIEFGRIVAPLIRKEYDKRVKEKEKKTKTKKKPKDLDKK